MIVMPARNEAADVGRVIGEIRQHCDYPVVVIDDASSDFTASVAREGGADVAVGACTGRGSLLRRIAWVLMKRTSGLTLDDITSGFRLYRRAAVEVLAGESATLLEYQDVGVLIALQENGFTVVDVPVPMKPRRSGISRIFYSWRSVSYYMAATMLLSVTKRNYGRRPARRGAP